MAHTNFPNSPAKAGAQTALTSSVQPLEVRLMFYVYIMASRPNGTLYIGHTDSLTVRVGQHRDDVRDGFTKRYGVKTLVWYEEHGSRTLAKQRETRMKKWNRAWKIREIAAMNPTWRDLYPDLFLHGPECPVGPPPTRGNSDS